MTEQQKIERMRFLALALIDEAESASRLAKSETDLVTRSETLVEGLIKLDCARRFIAILEAPAADEARPHGRGEL